MIDEKMMVSTSEDADGNLIWEEVEPSYASQEQIDEMVGMIEGGCPANLAASLVVENPQKENPS